MAGKPSAPSLDQQLRFAIAHRRLIRVVYHDKERLGEPHDYGLQNGVARLLFYQLGEEGDASLRPTPAGWRLLDVPKIGICVVMEETFAGSRGASHRQHHRWDKLFARVE